MVRYVMAKEIAHKYATRTDTVHRWAREGLLPGEVKVWANRGGEHAWEKDAFLDWEPPYKGYRKRMRIWEARSWNDGTDLEEGVSSVGASSDLPHNLASEGRIGSGGLDLSEGHASEDTVMLSPSEAARWIASRWEVSERTGRNWIGARTELLRTGPGAVVGIPLAALERLQRPARGRPSRKQP